MRFPTSRSDPSRRDAERRRRRRAGHRRLAAAVGLLLVIALGIGLGVGLTGRGGATEGTTVAAGGTGSTSGTPSTSISAGSGSTSPTGGGGGVTTATVTGGQGSTTSTVVEEGGQDGSTATTAAGPQAGAPMSYRADLDGQSEVPAVATGATGTLTLTVAADRSKVDYVLEVSDIRSLTVARLHEGFPGENGDTIVTIYPGPGKSGLFSGVVTRGSFTAEALVGPLAGESILDLLDLLQAGAVYLNVGTTIHRSGEIRGQLRLTPASTGQSGPVSIYVLTRTFKTRTG